MSASTGSAEFVQLGDFLAPQGKLLDVVTELRTRIEILQNGQRNTLETLRDDMQRWLQVLQEIKRRGDHESIIILGATGSGKSTIDNILCGRAAEAFKERGTMKLRIINPLEGAEQGHQAISHTTFPCGHVNDGVLFIDCPGLLTNQDANSIILNTYGIRETLKCFSPFKLLILIEEQYLIGRATSIIEIANEFSTYFNIETVSQSITMICSQQRDLEITDMRDQIRLIAGNREIATITERGRNFLNLISSQDVEWVSFSRPTVVGPYNTRDLVTDIRGKVERLQSSRFVSLPLVIPVKAQARLRELEQSVIHELTQFCDDSFLPFVQQLTKTKLNTCSLRLEFEEFATSVIGEPHSVLTLYDRDDLRNILCKIESQTQFLQSINSDFSNPMKRFEINLSLDVVAQYPEPGVVVIKGIFVTLQDVTNSLRDDTHTVRIYSIEAFIIPNDFTRSGLNIVLFARRLITDGSHIITLSGKDGQPGSPGKPGGSVYCEIGDSNTPGFRLIANGGKGGKGRDGVNGIDGMDGNPLIMSGRSAITKGPVQDYHKTGETYTNYWTDYFHDPGTPGTAGTSGSAGGLGARGGNIQAPPNIIVVRISGANGVSGRCGIGGRHGRSGTGVENWSQWHGNQAPPGARVSKGWSPPKLESSTPKVLSSYGPRAPSGFGIDMSGIIQPSLPRIFTQAEITTFKEEYSAYRRIIKNLCSFILDD